MTKEEKIEKLLKDNLNLTVGEVLKDVQDILNTPSATKKVEYEDIEMPDGCWY